MSCGAAQVAQAAGCKHDDAVASFSASTDIGAWLRSIDADLSKYANALSEYGYDTVGVVEVAEEADLTEACDELNVSGNLKLDSLPKNNVDQRSIMPSSTFFFICPWARARRTPAWRRLC